MANELKAKILMVAAVEANTAAEHNERQAELRYDKVNNSPEPFLARAEGHRARARALLNLAAGYAEFLPEEMDLLKIGTNQ